jgi:hypothetical protein
MSESKKCDRIEIGVGRDGPRGHASGGYGCISPFAKEPFHFYRQLGVNGVLSLSEHSLYGQSDRVYNRRVNHTERDQQSIKRNSMELAG